MNATVAAIDLELPERFSESQIVRDLERVRMEMLQQGLEPEEVEGKLAEIREQSTEQTINRMKGLFLIARLVEKYEISVSEQELNGSIATMAMRQGVRPDKLRSELAKENRLQQLAMTVRDRKTMDQLVAEMKQNDVTAEQWRTIQAKK